jgi:hypothetical protein
LSFSTFFRGLSFCLQLVRKFFSLSTAAVFSAELFLVLCL